MSRDKYTFIGHDGMDHCNPIAPAAVEGLIAGLGLAPAGSVLDVGCGKGELLVRLAELYRVRGVGIEHSPLMVREGRKRADVRAPGLIDIRQMDAAVLEVAPASLELVSCLGASHALGGTRRALETMTRWVRPGSTVLFGEGFWSRPPPQSFLDATGIERAEMMEERELLAAAAAAGLVLLRTVPTTLDDWDRYEAAHSAAIERYAEADPSDPDAPALVARSRLWHDVGRRFGRGVIGFALYLFRRPER